MKREANKPDLSLIIPAYNEEARIGKSLDRILRFLESQPYASEVIILYHRTPNPTPHTT